VIVAVVVLAALLLVSAGLAVTHILPGFGSTSSNTAGATATAGASNPTASATQSLSNGVLRLQKSATPAQVNLTTQGTADWAH